MSAQFFVNLVPICHSNPITEDVFMLHPDSSLDNVWTETINCLLKLILFRKHTSHFSWSSVLQDNYVHADRGLL